MRSKAKFMEHPIHQMLIVFPMGLLIASVVFDVLYKITRKAVFPAVAFYNIIAGVASGVVAAVFGLRDWLTIPGETRAKSVGARHGLGNAAVLGLFVGSGLMRAQRKNFVPGAAASIFSYLGAGLVGVTGWLGGELVNRLGVGVEPDAHLDAPSSLREPAYIGSRSIVEELVEDVLKAIPVTGSYKNREKNERQNLFNPAGIEPKVIPHHPEDLE